MVTSFTDSSLSFFFSRLLWLLVLPDIVRSYSVAGRDPIPIRHMHREVQFSAVAKQTVGDMHIIKRIFNVAKRELHW